MNLWRLLEFFRILLTHSLIFPLTMYSRVQEALDSGDCVSFHISRRSFLNDLIFWPSYFLPFQNHLFSFSVTSISRTGPQIFPQSNWKEAASRISVSTDLTLMYRLMFLQFLALQHCFPKYCDRSVVSIIPIKQHFCSQQPSVNIWTLFFLWILRDPSVMLRSVLLTWEDFVNRNDTEEITIKEIELESAWE